MTPGTRLGPYEIVSPIGAGGMGEVFKARDTRLDRSVAIKILPADFATNSQFRLRFEREAKTISQLNHPNICTLHDVGRDNGIDYLVMELIEGESLADRLSRGPLPISDTLKLGAQIADALDRAHRAGIVHRDLKPGNVMLTKSGVKLLDFGLAKSQASGLGPRPRASVLETEHKPLTEEGTIVGTFQYMAPEQLEGVEADARTDIFAFGVLLYEMATGRRAFEGKTKTSLIAAIVKDNPRPMAELQPLTPPALEHIVRKCLEKEPDDRWQSAHDVAEELRWISEAASQAGVTAPLAMRRKSRERIAWIAAGCFAILAALFGWRTRLQSSREPILRLAIPFPNAGSAIPFTGMPPVTISPDGTRVVYSLVEHGITRLWVRQLDRTDATQLAGSEGAVSAFFSPDGEWVGFYDGRTIKKISVSGGAALPICESADFRGATWAPDGTIYFSPFPAAGLWKVPASGGRPVALTSPNAAAGENSHRWPQLLPDGKHILFTIRTDRISSFDDARLAVLSLESGKWNVVFDGGACGRYASSGHLVFGRNSALYSVPFDLRLLRVTGSPARVVDGVVTVPSTGAAFFAFSDPGSLVYVPGNPEAATLSLLTADRAGHVTPLGSLRGAFSLIRASPDGRYVAARVGAANDDIWIIDSARDTSSRLSFEPGDELFPIWTADGSSVIYTSAIRGGSRLLRKPADGSGTPQELVRSAGDVRAGSCSPDGKLLVYTVDDPVTHLDVWLLSLADGKRTPLLQSPYNETAPIFSPDGKWIAYESDESGNPEIYVRSVTPGGGRWQISAGLDPKWSRDGRELYYRRGGNFYSVAVMASSSGFSAAKPEPLFVGKPLAPDPGFIADYDVLPNRRFVFTRLDTAGTAATQINFVSNWFDDLRRRSATR